MHRPIFGHSFAVLVAPILLSVLAFKFFNKRKADARGNAEDDDAGAPGSPTAPTETNSGGSSSLTGNCYEVFLSFRGPDTRNGFTDHLYHGLRDTGIHVFRDDDELPHGEKIGPELTAAITNSPILIPILSVTYGTSSWCLDELVQIMERKNSNGQMVLPIFYKVKPAEVRYQTGKFGDAFHKRETRLLKRSSFDPTILKKWKKTLDEVSTLKGYEADRYEGDLVKSIVQKVLSELKKKFELVMPKNLVGIDGHIEKVMKFVDDDSNAILSIGIYGMGGIGKTTLAKAIYNKLSNQFMYCSFIADIRESCQRNGLVYLQNQLIFDILKQKDQVTCKDDGIKFISSKFKNKKVLILLDDVDNDDQLKTLVGEHNWFSSGSRVLITTRNYDILEKAGVNHKYEHEVLNNDDSMVLFSRHAFRRSSPPREFDDLAHDVITTTGGLPLSVEVLGSLLCGKKIQFWRGTIDKLKKVPPKEVQEKLRVSYEALDDGQKQIFLDIACLFIGDDRRIAIYMWDANDFFSGEGIEVLIFMSLIKCGDDHVLRMHDQLRDLGRAIVREENQREPCYRSRLWDSKEAQKVLQKNQGTNKIEAIDLSKLDNLGSDWEMIDNLGSDWEMMSYTGEQFKNLTLLRFLRMKCAYFSGDFENSMEELKWLQWEKCPFNFEATNFHAKELVILQLSFSRMTDEWEGWRYFMMAKKLKFLNLTECDELENTGFLSAFKNLEVLILHFCRSLKRIDSSIGDMKSLHRLDLQGCWSLEELPAEIGELKALEQLLLNRTHSLSVLPDSITSLENLEVLDLSDSGVEELPKGIGKLRKLRELYASRCDNVKVQWSKGKDLLENQRYRGSFIDYKLQSLPDLPPSLKYLYITCKSCKLPSLSHLVHLKQLRFWECQSLECIVLPSALSKTSECSQLTDVEDSELHQSPNTPFELEYLDVARCGSIKTLNVLEYIRLRALCVEKCENLHEVQGMDKLIYLETLYVYSCNSIKQLDLPESKSLTYLFVEDCPNLVEIQGIDRLDFLESLTIKHLTSMKRLLLPKSQSLKRLSCYLCTKLTEIQGLHGLKFLEKLDISNCILIERVLLPDSRNLKELDAHGCKKLAEIEGLVGLEFLEHLDISNCTSIKRLEFPKSGKLQRLVAEGCENLVEIEGLDGLEFLEELCIRRCTSIERVLLSKSRSLKRLHADCCNNLAKIEGLDRLEFLELMDISECTLIKRLEFPESGRLKLLVVKGCENLVEIEGLNGLGFLEHLDISKCTLIERVLLPDSGNLKELYAHGCNKLAEIEGLNGMEFLECLDLSKCTSIKMLEFPKSGKLRRLSARGCENFLAEIQGLNGLEFLELLDISECTSIKRLEFPESGRLEILLVEKCENLAEIRGLDRLNFLRTLSIFGCKSLKTIPELSGTEIFRETKIYD